LNDLKNSKKKKNLIGDTMPTSIVTYQDFREYMRFDAEYYHEKYLEVENTLERIKSTQLVKIIDMLTNGVEVRDFVKLGIPYIRVSNTNKPFFINFSNIAFIRESAANKLSKDVSLNEGDILTNRSGTLGFSQIITKDFRKSVISSHNIRISGIKINPYYLVTFLNSRYGKLQILKRNNGGVVPEINQPALKSILVYLASENFQNKIEKQIKDSYKILLHSKSKLKEAEEILETELELDKIQTQNDHVTIIDHSDFISDIRLDAQYFSSNKLKSIFLNKFDSKPLKQLCDKIETGLTPAKDSYWHKGYPVLKMGCLTNSGIDWSKIEYANEDYFEKAKKYSVKEEDIFLTSSAHALEHIAKKVDIVIEIPKQYQNLLVFVGEVMRLRVKKESINPYYLLLFLRSELGYRLFQNCIRGQTAHIYPKDVEKIRIPLISTKKQEKIEELVKEAHTLLTESTKLIRESVNEVEKIIEHSG